MTTTLTERQAIERMMNYNEAERARLYASYEVYLDRLRELDEIDRVHEQATKVEEVNEEPFERQMVAQELVDEANAAAREELQKSIPEIVDQLKTHLDKINEESKNELMLEIVSQNKNLCNEVLQPEPEIPPTNVDEPQENLSAGLEPDKLEMRKTLMRGTTNDNKVVAQFAKVILKEHIKPMRSKELIKALNNAGIQMNHPNETLRQIRMHDPSIKNVAHGYYQYVK